MRVHCAHHPGRQPPGLHFFVSFLILLPDVRFACRRAKALKRCEFFRELSVGLKNVDLVLLLFWDVLLQDLVFNLLDGSQDQFYFLNHPIEQYFFLWLLRRLLALYLFLVAPQNCREHPLSHATKSALLPQVCHPRLRWRLSGFRLRRAWRPVCFSAAPTYPLFVTPRYCRKHPFAHSPESAPFP